MFDEWPQACRIQYSLARKFMHKRPHASSRNLAKKIMLDTHLLKTNSLWTYELTLDMSLEDQAKNHARHLFIHVEFPLAREFDHDYSNLTYSLIFNRLKQTLSG